MTGVTGIPDDVLERAVEAAAKAVCDDEVASGYSILEWGDSDCDRGWYLHSARAAVTAALAEVAPLATAETAKPAIDYCLERGYTLLYAANGPEPDMCVRLAVRDANELRAEVEALRATVARVEALADKWSDPDEPLGIIGLPWAMNIREALRKANERN